jgi:hypothetical protein
LQEGMGVRLLGSFLITSAQFERAATVGVVVVIALMGVVVWRAVADGRWRRLAEQSSAPPA